MGNSRAWPEGQDLFCIGSNVNDIVPAFRSRGQDGAGLCHLGHWRIRKCNRRGERQGRVGLEPFAGKQ